VAGLLPWLVPIALIAGLVLGLVRDSQGVRTDLGVDSWTEAEPVPERRSAGDVTAVFDDTLAIPGSQE
jgi:hypothetical protein